MRIHTSRAARATIVLALSCPVMVAAGCFTPDVEALTVKVREECRLAPLGPGCALNEPAASDYLYERWFLDEIDTEAEQDCLLALNCSPSDPDGSQPDDVMGCLRQDDQPVEALFRPHATDECIAECNNALTACGTADDCSVAVVKACLEEHDACLESCPRR